MTYNVFSWTLNPTQFQSVQTWSITRLITNDSALSASGPAYFVFTVSSRRSSILSSICLMQNIASSTAPTDNLAYFRTKLPQLSKLRSYMN